MVHELQDVVNFIRVGNSIECSQNNSMTTVLKYELYPERIIYSCNVGCILEMWYGNRNTRCSQKIWKVRGNEIQSIV